MKTRWMQLIAGLAMVVLCISTCTTTTNAVVIWEDDFDDGTYAPEWTICDNLTSAGFHNGDYGWSGSTWSATNNYLEKVTEASPGWGVISHPSNLAYGRWSFDFKANGTIFFISNNFYDMDDLYEDSSSYFVFFDVFSYDEEFAIFLAKRFDNTRTILDSHYHVPIAGWYHLDLTRNMTGGFTVYLNGSQIMQVVDTDIDTSEMFWLWFHNGDMIDNVVVDNIWDYTPTTPTAAPPPIPPYVWLLVGSAAVVIVVAVVFLRRR
ncbi:MAG: hypothetical protein PVJ05_09270 [Candidatus Thorarchaeota archaeon]|jgi:hypothetical protein